MKPFMIFCAALCCLAIGLAGTASGDCLCGDANCDGVTDAYDGRYIFNYICGGGPAPLTADLDHADWDGHRHLTISDIVRALWPSIYGESICPAVAAPLDPQVDTIS